MKDGTLAFTGASAVGGRQPVFQNARKVCGSSRHCGRLVVPPIRAQVVATGSERIPEKQSQVEEDEKVISTEETKEEADKAASELVGSLTATTDSTPERRSRKAASVIRATDARKRAAELLSAHGRGKAVKQGRRNEASKEFTELIATCGRSGLYQLALDVFDEASRNIGVDAELCTAALRAALSAKYPEKALNIWERAMEREIQFPKGVYAIAVSGFIGCDRVDDAMDFKKRLEERAMHLDLFAYNAIIEYYAGKGDLRTVLQYVEEAKSVGHQISHHTESLVLRCVFRTGLGLSGCIEWIEEHQYEFSRACLQAVLEECLSVNDRNGASQVLELMRKNGKWARVRTYNSFINFFARNKDATGAFRTFDALKANSIIPTAHSYYLLAMAAVRSDSMLQEAQELLDSAAESLHESYFAYTARALLAAKRGEDTCGIFRDMYENGLIPDDAAFAAVFEAMSGRQEKDTLSTSLKLVDLMNELGLRGTRTSMNALMKVFRVCGAAIEAVELFRSMSSSGVRRLEIAPDVETYEIVLEACGNGKRMDLAVGVFRELESREERPTVTLYSIMVQGFGHCNDLSSALGVWNEMKDNGLRPNRIAYMRMVEACLKQPTGISHACAILDEMSIMGFSVNKEHYDTLIRGFSRAKDLEKVMSRFQGLPKYGGQVDEVVFGAMLNACSNNDALPTVEETMDHMVTQGIRPARQVMEYFSEGGRSVSRSKNKMIQEVWGMSGVDIVRGYLPKREVDEYSEFKALFSGHLREPVPIDPSQENKISVEESMQLEEKVTRQKALERPGGPHKKGQRIRRRMGRRNR